MEAKKELARRIVQDFHGEQAAKHADENWAKQFQKDEVPEDVERVVMSISEVGWKSESANLNFDGIRLDKVLLKCGLASSGAEATRKIKEGAVRIGENVAKETRVLIQALPAQLSLRLGKRAKIAIIQ